MESSLSIQLKKGNITQNEKYWRGSIHPVDMESIPIRISQEGGCRTISARQL